MAKEEIAPVGTLMQVELTGLKAGWPGDLDAIRRHSHRMLWRKGVTEIEEVRGEEKGIVWRGVVSEAGHALVTAIAARDETLSMLVRHME